jgi:hypothetical protein
VHFHSPRAEANPEITDPGDPEPPGEATDMHPLVLVDGVDGVAVAAHGSNLDRHPTPSITNHDVDLPAIHFDVARNDGKATCRQPPSRELLTGRAQFGAARAQSLSSVFSSFSTLTSRKVRTWTCSRKRAGRNMSQTQASLITTSK